MAQKSYESLPDAVAIIDKVKSIVKWFKHSVVGSDELRKKTELTLIQSVSTRWNSTFYMLERFLQLREVVASIVNFNKSAPPMLSATDMEFLQEFCTLFKSIGFATTQASGEKFVTASCVIPVVKMMQNKINAVSCCSEPVSYTHLDVYKRQAPSCQSIDVFHHFSSSLPLGNSGSSCSIAL